nr:MAG TPA: hypothetical protein [Caudoviricetes sp.]
MRAKPSRARSDGTNLFVPSSLCFRVNKHKLRSSD